MIQLGVTITVDNDGKVESQVYIGTSSWLMGQERKDEKVPLDIHRQATQLYSRTLDFAEQIKR